MGDEVTMGDEANTTVRLVELVEQTAYSRSFFVAKTLSRSLLVFFQRQEKKKKKRFRRKII